MTHSLGDGQYEIRVRQCAAAVATLQLKYPQIKNLRDATLSQLQQVEAAMDETAFFRARHVVMENDRVQQSVQRIETALVKRGRTRCALFNRSFTICSLPLSSAGPPSPSLRATTRVWAS